MRMSVWYNGHVVRIEDEHGHYKLSCMGIEQRCDSGELREAIPEFVDRVNELQLVAYR